MLMDRGVIECRGTRLCKLIELYTTCFAVFLVVSSLLIAQLNTDETLII